jgi:hypothetical protein
MSAITGIPIQVDPEASARVAELGMQKEFQLMLDHARQVIPELQQIHVTLEPPYDTGDEPRVVTEALRGGPFCEDDPTRRQWTKWEIETFPADVLRHFTTLILFGSPDAR